MMIFLAESPEYLERFRETFSAEPVAFVVVINRNLRPTKLMHNEADFGLEEIGLANHPALQDQPHRLPIETLKTAGHITHLSLEQPVSQDPAAPTH